jgi:hypothetical protein
MHDKLLRRVRTELRKLPRRQDLSGREYAKLVTLHARQIAHLTRIVHSGVPLVLAGAGLEMGREHAAVLQKFADCLDAVADLIFSDALYDALEAAGLDAKSIHLEELEELAWSVRKDIAPSAMPRKQGRPPELSRQILMNELAKAYLDLTGKMPKLSKLGFPPFGRAVFEKMGLVDPLSPTVSTDPLTHLFRQARDACLRAEP